MLLNSLGLDTTQEKITIAAGVQKTIEAKGTRIDQLAKAVEELFSDFHLLFQMKSKLEDIDLLINTLEIPVAVEWQGVFDDPQVEDEEGDYGHYSIISHIDIAAKRLIIVDPYKDFIDRDRIFTFKEFTRRWWDSNEFIDEFEKSHYVVDEQLLFIIVPKSQKLPSNLNLRPGLEFNPLNLS